MNAQAAALHPLPGRRWRVSLGSSASWPLAARGVSFAALCGFAAGHWFGLVQGVPASRVLLVTLIATGGGLALALTGGGLRRSRPIIAVLLRGPIVLATGILALLAAGLPARLVPPGRWGELADGIDRGLAGVPTVDWPYGGGEHWLGLTVVLAAPVVCALASALAFWPARRAASTMRAAGLLLLLVLYGTAATEHDYGEGLARGLVLFVLLATWIWLPRLQRVDALLALAAVAAAGLLSLPLASGADRDSAWVDYSSWQWFRSDAGATFNWNHTYGPIGWQRDGTTVLQVRSSKAHYWKAQTLDRFDGLRWVHSPANERVPATFEIPDDPRRQWIRRASFTVRSFETSFVVGTGTTFDVDGAGIVTGSGDGTIRMLDEPLEEGDTYTIRAYVPDPSAREMRAAPPTTENHFLQYMALVLPGRGETALGHRGSVDLRTLGQGEVPAPPSTVVPPQVITAPEVVGTAGAAEAERRLLASPYARVYRLARRLAAGRSTDYDVVKSIERHLAEGYRYSERPPNHEYPLASFLIEDRVGYCQQFAGAMALMLRMNGIPARVAAGFSPGSYDKDAREYRVRDLDAHSWVEVYFEGLGWVPFDPTPSLAPAESQLGGSDAPSAAQREAGDSPEADRPQPLPSAGDAARAAGSRQESTTLDPWLAAVALGSLVLLGLGGQWVWQRRRARTGQREADLRLIELRRALDRLGYAVPAGTTLGALERRLRAEAGAPAGRYVRRLAEQLYARSASTPPDRRARRALRRALTRNRGVLAVLHGYLALPPSVGRSRSARPGS